MATGKWPMIISVQSGLSPGNHSVVIAARDILGLTANATLNYLLEEEERARQNRMCNWYTSTVPILQYDNDGLSWDNIKHVQCHDCAFDKCILAICGNSLIK